MHNLLINVNKTIDLCGLRCPEPLMIIRRTIRKMPIRHTLLIISDDFSIIKDISIFCNFMKHILLYKYTKKLPYNFLIQKCCM